MKALFTAILLLLVTGTFATQVNFESTLDAALKKAKEQNKLVFIEYYNSECHVCKKLEPVFSNDTLSDFYNKYFICYKLNTEKIKKEDSLFIAHAGLTFESVPYFLFFDKDGHFVHYADPKQDVDFLVNAGAIAMEPTERTGALEGKYQSGDRSIKTLYAYSNLLKLYKNDAQRKIVAEQLYNVFPKDELGTKKSYIITKNCVDDIDNGFFKYWIMHTDEIKAFEKNPNTAHETNVLSEIVRRSVISDAHKKWDAAKIKQVKEWILKTGLSKDPDAYFQN
ncbi:MAG TPA: thioredoxin family protein [Ferruginibacter sp.]|nr:thioredoxin family protein [Ferruginibacter sp.]